MYLMIICFNIIDNIVIINVLTPWEKITNTDQFFEQKLDHYVFFIL